MNVSRFVQEMLVDRDLIRVGNKIVHKRYGQGVITYVDEKNCAYILRKTERLRHSASNIQ